MVSIEIYILTHKNFNEDYDKNIFFPIHCGSALSNTSFNYMRDDSGKNISRLNNVFAELTGQYWVWKHSQADIIGFCHYRRYFSENIFLTKKLGKSDIISLLQHHDMILPTKAVFSNSVENQIRNINKINEGFPKFYEFERIKEIISNKYPSYLDFYIESLNSNTQYNFNMFIARKEVVDDYFSWLFDILFELFNKYVNLNDYPKDNCRILGYISEILLDVYVKHNKLRVVEKPIYAVEAKIPFLVNFMQKHPRIKKFSNNLL